MRPGADGVSCDETGCVAQMAGGGFVALALKPEALADDCERAALVVTARQAPASCQSTVIAGERLRGQAGMALWRTRDGYAVTAIRPKEPRSFASKPVDATPAEADQQGEE